MDGWKDGWVGVDGWMGGSMDEWIGGWDGWMDAQPLMNKAHRH